jgi:hypothetical protein
MVSGCGGGDSSSGGGTPPPPSATQFSVSPASGSVTSGNALNISVQALDNSNNLVSSFAGPLQVSSSDPNAALPGSLSLSGGQTTFSVTFNTVGNQTVSVSSGSLSGTSKAISVNPAVLVILTGALANGVIGTPYNQSIQATGGVAPFAWTVISGTLPHNLSLNPSTTNMVTISGTPDTALQGVAFTLQVTDSAHHTALQPYSVSILLQPDALNLSSGSFNFGNQILGSASSAQSETLTNTGTVDVAISSIAITMLNPPQSNPGEFTQSSTTCGSSLPAGASCAINLIFTPAQTGNRTAILTITDDTAGSPQQAGLTGVGLSMGPNATLSSPVLSFTTQLVPTKSPPQYLQLTNYGAVALTIGSITSNNNVFAETDNCGASLASAASCTINVTFTPGGQGLVNGTLSIADDAADTPQTVSLSGTGATTTPLLNGYCYSHCKPEVHVSACPAGQLSKTPGHSGCPFGPNGGTVVPVDLDTPCAIPPGSWFDRGYCVIE